MPKLSVIIPVYNGEEHLNKCIDSVLLQTETDIEIILVNDGSTDNSGRICDEYAKKDKRIRVIHQENAGVSVARNNGISAATGEYIGFVDSDDWVDADMYESLLREAESNNADVVMCDATTIYENGEIQADTITQLSGNKILHKSDFTPSLLLEMAGSACRCIYSKNIYNNKLCEVSLAFPLGVKFSEDRIFNLYAFGLANKTSYSKHSFYNRFMNKKSAVHRFHDDYFEAYKLAADGVKKAIEDVWDNEKELQKAYLRQLIQGAFMAICNYYYNTSPLSKKQRKEMVKKICNDARLINAIETYGTDNKSKWILNKNYSILILYAKLTNLKHKR